MRYRRARTPIAPPAPFVALPASLPAGAVGFIAWRTDVACYAYCSATDGQALMTFGPACASIAEAARYMPHKLAVLPTGAVVYRGNPLAVDALPIATYNTQ